MTKIASPRLVSCAILAVAFSFDANLAKAAWIDLPGTTTIADYGYGQPLYNSVPAGAITVGFPSLTAETASGSVTTLPTSSSAVTLTSTGDAQIVTGSLGGQYANPYGNTANYLAVYGIGSASFTLTHPTSYFGFDWGSVDNFNSVTVNEVGGASFSLSGAEVTSNAVPLSVSTGDQGPGGTDYIGITDTAGIESVIFYSTGNSFEVSDVTVIPVSSPGTLPLFGSAIAILAVARRRRARKAG